jgi:DNA repair ATPase RecN
LRQIETSDERERALNAELAAARERYLDLARKLHKERMRAAKKFEQAVEKGIAEVAIDNARFQVQVLMMSSRRDRKASTTLSFIFPRTWARKLSRSREWRPAAKRRV